MRPRKIPRIMTSQEPAEGSFQEELMSHLQLTSPCVPVVGDTQTTVANAFPNSGGQCPNVPHTPPYGEAPTSLQVYQPADSLLTPPSTYFVRDANGLPQKPTARQISEGLARRGLPITHRPHRKPGATSSAEPFNIFSAILDHSDLTLSFALALRPRELMLLYSMSKQLYYCVNSHYTTFMLHSTRIHAPTAERIFPPKCYRTLCVRDPALRELSRFASSDADHDTSQQSSSTVPSASSNTQQSANEASSTKLHDTEADPTHSQQPPTPTTLKKNTNSKSVRFVPGLKWLQMVCYREAAVEQIILLLALEGHRLPSEARTTIKKLWFLMDVGSNGSRIALVHNRKYFRNEDLYFATAFFLKLDMRFMDPVDGLGENSMRRLLLGQRGLTTLLKVLKGEELRSYRELVHMHVRSDYEATEENREMDVFGVHAGHVGQLGREGWGRGSKRLIGPDDLIMREGIRRGMRLHRQYFDIMIWGFVNYRKAQDIAMPDLKKIMSARLEKLREPSALVSPEERSDELQDVAE